MNMGIFLLIKFKKSKPFKKRHTQNIFNKKVYYRTVGIYFFVWAKIFSIFYLEVLGQVHINGVNPANIRNILNDWKEIWPDLILDSKEMNGL